MKKWMIAGIALLAVAGCGKSDNANAPATPPGAKAEPAATGQIVAYRNADGKLTCPVMNTVIESESKAVGYQDYEGVRYYFCCDSCPPLFKDNPQKYAKK